MKDNEFLNTNAAELPVMRLIMLAGIAADVLTNSGKTELANQLRNAAEEI